MGVGTIVPGSHKIKRNQLGQYLKKYPTWPLSAVLANSSFKKFDVTGIALYVEPKYQNLICLVWDLVRLVLDQAESSLA